MDDQTQTNVETDVPETETQPEPDAQADVPDAVAMEAMKQKLRGKRSIADVMKQHAAQAGDPNSTLSKRTRKTGGDARGKAIGPVFVTYFSQNPKKDDKKTGSDSLAVVPLTDCGLEMFDRPVRRAGAEKSDSQLHALSDDKSFTINANRPFMLGGPTNSLGVTSAVPGQSFDLIGTKYEITKWGADNVNLKVLVHDVVSTKSASYNELMRVPAAQKSLIGVAAHVGTDPATDQTRRLFGHDSDHPDKYAMPIKKDKDGKVIDRKPDVTVVFNFVPQHEATQLEESGDDYVFGVLEPGLVLDKIGLVHVKDDTGAEITKRAFNAVRANATTNAQRNLIVTVFHKYGDYDNAIVRISTPIYAESVGQFEVQDDSDWEIFAGTFYSGARGLLLGPLMDGSADDDDDQDDDDVSDAIKAKLKMYVDLEGTIRNVGVKCDPEVLKQCTGKIWKMKKYPGHHMGRNFPTFANGNAKMKYSVMHRAGERATNLKSIRGDLNPTYEALKSGALELWAVTPHRMDHEQIAQIQAMDTTERLNAYTDVSNYSHLETPPSDPDEVPRLFYLVVAKSNPDPLIVINGSIDAASKTSPFNPKYVGPLNEKARDEQEAAE